MDRIIFLFSGLFIWTSCDPMRRINMKNRTGGPAEVTWMIKADSINASPFFISSSKDVTFQLPHSGPAHDIRMSFGVGTWTKNAVNNLVDDLDSLVIRWNNREIRLGAPEEIRDYLMPRRKGVGKDKIEILLKD